MKDIFREVLGLIGGFLVTQIIWFGSYSPIDLIEIYADSWPTIRNLVYISTSVLIYIAALGGIVVIIGVIFANKTRTVLNLGRLMAIIGLSLTLDMTWDVIGIVSIHDRIIVLIAWIGLIMTLGVTAMTGEKQSNQGEEMQTEDL
jgi:hypothetical protein